MLRKTHLLIAALVAIVSLVSTSAAGAYGPTAQGANQNQPRQGFLVEGVAVTQADESNPPSEALRSATKLRASLTAKQRSAIQGIWKRHEAQLAAITAQLPALRDSVAPSADPAAAQARLTEAAAAFQAVRQLNQRAQTLQTQLDSEVGTVLTDDQRALHRAALAPIAVDAGAAMAAAQATTDGQSLAPIAVAASTSTVTAQAADGVQSPASGSASPMYNSDYNSSYCYYAAQYSTFADYYSYLARIYAYYNYYYNTYGSYDAYYYLYFANSYAISGHYYISAVYMDELVLHADPFGRASAGRSDEASATSYAYYGLNYAYQNYNNYGYAYAYYAYVYGSYTNQYAYYVYAYSAYC
jgi:hypothetical protein